MQLCYMSTCMSRSQMSFPLELFIAGETLSGKPSDKIDPVIGVLLHHHPDP